MPWGACRDLHLNCWKVSSHVTSLIGLRLDPGECLWRPKRRQSDTGSFVSISATCVCVCLVTWLWLVYLKDPTVAPLDGVLCCPSSRLPLRSSGVNSSGEIVNFFIWIRTLLLRVDLHLLEETRVLSPEGIACFRRLQRRHYKSTPVSDLYWTISFSFDFAMDSATSAGAIEFRSKILFLEFSTQMMKRPSNRRWWSTSFLVDLMKVYF